MTVLSFALALTGCFAVFSSSAEFKNRSTNDTLSSYVLEAETAGSLFSQNLRKLSSSLRRQYTARHKLARNSVIKDLNSNSTLLGISVFKNTELTKRLKHRSQQLGPMYSGAMRLLLNGLLSNHKLSTNISVCSDVFSFAQWSIDKAARSGVEFDQIQKEYDAVSLNYSKSFMSLHAHPCSQTEEAFLSSFSNYLSTILRREIFFASIVGGQSLLGIVDDHWQSIINCGRFISSH